MPERTEREKLIAKSARLGAVAELQGIRLCSLELQLGVEVPDPPYDVGIIVNPSVEVKDSTLRYEIKYEVSGNKETISIFSLSCIYQVFYSIPEDVKVGQDEVEAFGSTTVLFTAHPYLRELASNVTARAGLPPLTLGLMRLPLEVSQMLAEIPENN